MLCMKVQIWAAVAVYSLPLKKKIYIYTFFKEINTIIQQGYIKLIKSDSKYIYTKDFYFK